MEVPTSAESGDQAARDAAIAPQRDLPSNRLLSALPVRLRALQWRGNSHGMSKTLRFGTRVRIRIPLSAIRVIVTLPGLTLSE
jgi:hypothetical protein